jgi:predicted homoserine dehydrogenase-like protein
MFTTVEQVKSLTGYDVSLEQITRAQGILESFLGKVEVEIESAYDLAVMARACAYQTAYMANDVEKVFEQVAIKQILQADGGVTLDNNRHAPWIAPLAHIAMSALTWKRSRSVRTGPMHNSTGPVPYWEVN